MKKIVILIQLILFSVLVLLTSCSNKKEKNQSLPLTDIELCNIDSIYEEIYHTNEIQFLNKNLKDNFNSNISFLMPDSVMKKDSTISIWVGYDGPFRWENYYTFYVKLSSCEIFTYDDKLGTHSLKEWDKLKTKQRNGELFYDQESDMYIEIKPDSLFNNLSKLKSYLVPFDFSKYFNSCLARGTELCDTILYPRYDCDDNHELLLFYNKIPKDEVSYYSILFSNNSFLAILFEFRPEEAPLNYRLVTLGLNGIISELSIDDKDNFIIYPNKIEIYENVVIQESEEGNYDSFTQIENGKLLYTYQITNEGKIIKE